MGDWHYQGVKRRDFRHQGDGPEALPRTGKRRRKDTKKWCKGKVGVEHTLVINKRQRWYGFDGLCEKAGRWDDWNWCYHQKQCTTCGKILVPFLPQSECPDLQSA